MEQLFQERKDTHKHKHTLTFFIFIFFITILIFVIYSSFNDGEFSPSLTGNIIKSSDSKTKSATSVQINAKLTPPENLNLETQTEKISLKTKSPTILHLGKQKFELESKSSIVIDDFEGEISINTKNISELNGKTTKVYIDGIPITPTKNTKIFFDNSLEYSYLKINNLQTSLEYITSGDISLHNSKIRIRLDNEKIILKNFQGDLEISKELRLEGFIPESSVKNLLEIVSQLSSEEEN